MSAHAEFDLKADMVKASEQAASEVARYLPNAVALANELKALFGEDCKTLMLAEGDKLIKAKDCVPDQCYLDGASYLALPRLIALDASMIKLKAKNGNR